MRISTNELLCNMQDNHVFRILWIDSKVGICYLIDIQNSNAWPYKSRVKDILDDLISEELIKIKDDPYFPHLFKEVPEPYIQKRDEAWNIIRNLVLCEPEVYEKSQRNAMIEKVLTQREISRPTIQKYLRRYWQRGKAPDALLPDYQNSGGKGKDKSASERKRGRPAIYYDGGINVDEQTKKIFKVIVEKYYLTPKKSSLTHAYRMMIKEFYVEDYYIEDDQKKLIIADHKKLPTLRQFRYWFNKEYGLEEVKIARHGRRIYEKDFRPVLGSSTQESLGPGSRFQIDATVVNVYLVSKFNRNWIIGRPVLYVIVDVFSRMVVGLYVGLEGPSWMGAMMAIANAASDKVSFCAQYGINIPQSAWPCEHLPEVLLADRGELEGYNVERLITAFNLHVENTAPYRPDWKGVVEKQFDLVHERVKPFVPGYVDKDFQERGARDYRLDAKLTLEEFTKILIHLVLKYNISHYLADYLRDEEMITDGVEPIPLQLWNWGIASRSGRLRYFPDKLIRLHLLPQDFATVTFKGIKFQNMLYGLDHALKEGWFSIARQKGSWKVKVSYDPRDVSVIYLWLEDQANFELCHLLDHQQRYKNKTLDEVRHLFAYEKRMRANSERAELNAEINWITEVQGIVKEAEKQADNGRNPSLSKSQRIKATREHRKEEREAQRKEEAFVDRLENKTPQEKKAEVITLQTRSTSDDFKRPTIKEFLRRNKEHSDNE